MILTWICFGKYYYLIQFIQNIGTILSYCPCHLPPHSKLLLLVHHHPIKLTVEFQNPESTWQLSAFQPWELLNKATKHILPPRDSSPSLLPKRQYFSLLYGYNLLQNFPIWVAPSFWQLHTPLKRTGTQYTAIPVADPLGTFQKSILCPCQNLPLVVIR